VVDAEPNAAVWLGLEEWVTPERFSEAISRILTSARAKDA